MTAPTLTEFLLARIADDENVAEKGGSHPGTWGVFANDNYGHLLVQPERVLAECEAKRRIVARHSLHPHYPVCEWCYVSEPEFQAAPYPCVELRDMASAYADHPDFDEAWRP